MTAFAAIPSNIKQTTGLPTPSVPTTFTSPGTSYLDSIDKPKMDTNTSTYVDPKSMVANQLTSLLNSDSPYLKQARSESLELANKMGMSGSTMAAGAGEAAAIKAALPIATSDATTWGNAAALNQKSFLDQKNNLQTGYINNAIQSAKGQMDFANQQTVNDTSRANTITNAEATLRSNYSTDTSNLISNLNNTVANIQSNPNMSPEQKTEAISGVLNNSVAGLNNISTALGFNKVDTSWSNSGNTSLSSGGTTPVTQSPTPVSAPSTTNTPTLLVNGKAVTFVPKGDGTYAGTDGLTYSSTPPSGMFLSNPILKNFIYGHLNIQPISINGINYYPINTQQ